MSLKNLETYWEFVNKANTFGGGDLGRTHKATSGSSASNWSNKLYTKHKGLKTTVLK
jgi:hypothetical protein